MVYNTDVSCYTFRARLVVPEDDINYNSKYYYLLQALNNNINYSYFTVSYPRFNAFIVAV